MELNALSQRLEQLAALAGEETGTDLPALVRQLEESVGSRVEAVASEVRRTVAAALEREAAVAAATQIMLAEGRSSLESRLAVLEDTLDALAERLEAVARDGVNTTRDQLGEMAASIAAIDQRSAAALAEQGALAAAPLRSSDQAPAASRRAPVDDAPGDDAPVEEPRRLFRRHRP